jgi:hypothetical protein
MTTLPDRCSHGMPWAVPCRECEIVSARETIAHWGPAVREAEKILREAEKKDD